MNGPEFDADVLILGAGPAGSTVAHLLAKHGHSVRVLEKETFPRFHVGESLLPIDEAIFARLGFVADRDRYLYKAGAEFLDERTGEFAEYPFSDALPGTPDHAWQVDRARFDEELADLAEAAGVEIRYGVKVTAVDIDDDAGHGGVTVTAADGEHRGRYVIDATGQDAFIARRRKLIHPVKGFGVIAAFSHFTNLSDEVAEELAKKGNVKILIHDDGWAWLIPLAGKRLGFGVVSRRGGVGAQIVDEVAAKSELIQRLSRGADRTEPTLIRHFAYLNTKPYGSRYACVGDSAAFLDPVFSSGISLAMQAAEHVADTLAPALTDGSEGRDDLMDPVQARLRDAYIIFGSLIKSFYSTNLVNHFFFHPDPEPELRAGLTSILAGDVFRDDNRFQDLVVNSRRRWTPESQFESASAPVDA
ncbi:MAG: FAD-dependent oxidoreductase [Deltaproteobacteria bacterium]|nr:FAD-dependent oxidoreductase [Deltaproteobacteria bacterium]